MDDESEVGKRKPRSAYDLWQEQQGVPIYRGYHVEDLRTLELGPWQWLGGNGAILNLADQVTDDAWIVDIPPGSSLSTLHHLFEVQVLVLSGRGAAEVWQHGGEKTMFEWGPYSLFSPPLNSYYRLHNGDGSRPARLFVLTAAPTMLNLLRDRSFVFDNPHVFAERFAGEFDYFTRPGEWIRYGVWKTNFVPNVRSLELKRWPSRGYDTATTLLSLSGNAMAAHISEFAVGTYKKAHRHQAGAHVIVITGEGYSLMWPPGTEHRRFDWRAGGVLSPPEAWFHQHFNVGAEPARYVALRWNSPEYPTQSYWMEHDEVKGGVEQIDYEDEDPRVRETFESELARRRVRSRLPTAGARAGAAI